MLSKMGSMIILFYACAMTNLHNCVNGNEVAANGADKLAQLNRGNEKSLVDENDERSDGNATDKQVKLSQILLERQARDVGKKELDAALNRTLKNLGPPYKFWQLQERIEYLIAHRSPENDRIRVPLRQKQQKNMLMQWKCRKEFPASKKPRENLSEKLEVQKKVCQKIGGIPADYDGPVRPPSKNEETQAS